MAEDYYKVLGVSRNASPADIQQAYRNLARKYHPDMNPDDKTAKKKFQEVQAAFDVLNDPQKRELYDRYGSSFESMGAGRGQPGGGATWSSGAPGSAYEDVDLGQVFGERFGGGDTGSTFADLFSQFRRADGGGRRRKREPGRGADVTAEVEIPFDVSIRGGQTQLGLRRPSGDVETLVVKIPVGIADGKKMRLRGQGEPSAEGGPSGDLFVTIHVAPHPFFHRRGNNLYVTVPVTLAEAAAGAKVDVPTPKGTISLRVPPGSSGGTKLRVKGHGAAPAGSEPGDLFAEIQIVLPKSIDEESLEQIKKLDAAWNAREVQNPRRDLRW